MQIVYGLEQPITSQPCALAIGNFDGVHIGHQHLIRTAVTAARYHGFVSAVLTFDPHPRTVVRPDQPLALLTNLEERAALIAELEPDFLVIAPFSRAVMSIPAFEYMQNITHVLPIRELVVGDDFALGRNREGTIPRLIEIGRDLGYGVEAIAPVRAEGDEVHSRRIRQLLLEGQVEAARPLLGRPYGVLGNVVHGDQRGRSIGFPTANLAIDQQHLVPRYGVYACRARLGGLHGPAYAAVTNVGVRPTFSDSARQVEAHLFDFDADLYGSRIWLEFVHFLRPEQKFASLAELQAQIARDSAQARALLSS